MFIGYAGVKPCMSFSDFLQGEAGRLTNIAYPYHEVIIDTPLTIAVTTTPTQMLAGQAYKWVFSFIIRVRDMGTTTYVRLGGQLNQNYTLIATGQAIIWSGNTGEVADLSKMFCVSDGNSAVLEVIAAYVPLHLVGLVEQGVGMGL
jgi:hypothetical protein